MTRWPRHVAHVVPVNVLALLSACEKEATHPWPAMETTASTALTPGITRPAQASTQEEFPSPRGCRRTVGSVGIANATRIEANFTGTDCQLATLNRTVVPTRE